MLFRTQKQGIEGVDISKDDEKNNLILMEIKINKRFRKDVGNLESLKKSIQEIGLLHPIVIDSNGNLIAGERRYKACLELGIDPEYRIVDIENSIKAELDENQERVNFTYSEIYEISQYINQTESRKRGPKENNFCLNQAEINPRDKVADITGLGKDTISKINTIFNSDNEKLKNDLDEKKISVDKAYKQVKKEEKKEQKIKELEIASEQYNDNDDIKIYFEDFRIGLKNVPDNYVDAIITDPPYPIEYIDLWEAMFIEAERVLKPSGWLVAYANHQNLDLIFRLINPLKYYWTFKLDFTSKPIAMGRNLIATWKPVLIYQKLPFKKIEETLEDNVKEYKPFNYSERDLHDLNWGQSLGKFEYLIDKFTKPGDLIVEPFAGTGTTLVAAKNMKRKCIGYEIEKDQYEKIIKGRLENGR